MRLAPFPSWQSDALYKPTPYDVRTGANQQRVLARRVVTFTALGAGNPVLYTVPVNKALVLTSAFAACSSDTVSAETIRLLNLQVWSQAVLPAVFDVFDIRNNTAAGFGQSVDRIWQGELVLMPGELLVAQATKGAAVDSFSLVATIAGLLIPRANIQLG